MVVHPSHGLVLVRESTHDLQRLDPVHNIAAESEILINEQRAWRKAGIIVKGVAELGNFKALLVSKKDSTRLLAVWSSALTKAMKYTPEKTKKIINAAISGNHDRSQTCTLATLPEGTLEKKVFNKVG